MAIATRDTILGAYDNETRDIDGKGWGTLRIRTMSAAERLMLTKKYQTETLTNDQAAAFYCELIAMCLVGEDGRRLFDTNGDIEVLQTRDWKLIELVVGEILAFNGLAENSVEEMAKN
uniref:Tail assembly chaperone n=1 Tax=viral metagenome TaxID=1070528 RepID=A0A6M3L8P0_9ZZZZ